MKVTKRMIWTYLISILVFLFLYGIFAEVLHFGDLGGMVLSGFLVTFGLIIFFNRKGT